MRISPQKSNLLMLPMFLVKIDFLPSRSTIFNLLQNLCVFKVLEWYRMIRKRLSLASQIPVMLLIKVSSKNITGNCSERPALFKLIPRSAILSCGSADYRRFSDSCLLVFADPNCPFVNVYHFENQLSKNRFLHKVEKFKKSCQICFFRPKKIEQKLLDSKVDFFSFSWNWSWNADFTLFT